VDVHVVKWAGVGGEWCNALVFWDVFYDRGRMRSHICVILRRLIELELVVDRDFLEANR